MQRTTPLSVLLLAALISTSCASAEPLAITTDTVEYTNVSGTATTGFLAQPEKEGRYPAIVLIHEWWGLNDHIRGQAREFAKLGYVALAVDLYAGKSTTDPAKARELAVKVQGDMATAQQNLSDAIAYLKNSKQVDPQRLASIGWCFGGGWSYQMAKNDLGVKASIIYYGRFNPRDDLAKMRASIIGHFAEKDRAIRVDNVKEFQAKLKTLKGDHEIYIYPNTTHGFASRKGENPEYDEAAADLAWQRTLAFLKKHL